MKENMPFYLDWNFWTVIIVFMAVILSQIPPLHILFRKVKIDCDIHSKIFIHHKVGNHNLQIHTIINNIGNGSVKIKNINATIIRDNKKIVILPVQSFLMNQFDANPVLFTPFLLKPNDEWSNTINLLNYFNGKDELKEISKHYKFGDGIFLNMEKHGLILELKEI